VQKGQAEPTGARQTQGEHWKGLADQQRASRDLGQTSTRQVTTDEKEMEQWKKWPKRERRPKEERPKRPK